MHTEDLRQVGVYLGHHLMEIANRKIPAEEFYDKSRDGREGVVVRFSRAAGFRLRRDGPSVTGYLDDRSRPDLDDRSRPDLDDRSRSEIVENLFREVRPAAQSCLARPRVKHFFSPNEPNEQQYKYFSRPSQGLNNSSGSFESQPNAVTSLLRNESGS